MLAKCGIQNDEINVDEFTMAAWEDEVLVSCVTGEKPHWKIALKVLTERQRPWIFRRCLFRLGNYHDAEDATQDVIVRVFAKLKQFEGRSKFSTWLNIVTDNYCYTFAKRRSRYATSEHIEQLIELHQTEESISTYTSAAADVDVRAILFRMPENASEILKLRFFDGYSLNEISNRLNISLSATKARLYRAIDQFKYLYSQDEAGYTPCLASI